MPLARYTAAVLDAAGNAVPGCAIEVRNEDTGLLARLYSDRDGLSPISNSFDATEATFSFHTTGGAYRVRATKGAFSVEWRFVAVGTMQEQDVEGIVFSLQAGVVPALTAADLDLYIPPVPEEGEALPRAGVVYADPVKSNNGYWVYSFDDEEWQFARPLSDTLARLTVVDGDENDIVATSFPGVDPSSVVAFFIDPDEPNTGPVTVSIDGNDPVPAYDYTGNQFPAGAFAGRVFLTLEEDGSLRSVMPADLVAQAQYWAELSEQVALPDGVITTAKLADGGVTEPKLDAALAAKINDKLDKDAANVGDATAQAAFRAAIGVTDGAWELIGTASPSGVLSADFINLSAFRKLRMTFLIAPASDNVNALIRTDNNNGASFDDGASDYAYVVSYTGGSSISVANNAASTAASFAIGVGNDVGEFVAGVIVVDGWNQALRSTLNAQASWRSQSGTFISGQAGMQRLSASAQDAIQIRFASGNIASGFVMLEGVRG